MAKKSFWQRGEDYAKKVSDELIGVTSRNGKNRTLRPIEKRQGQKLPCSACLLLGQM